VHFVHRPLIGLLYQPRMIDDECGVVGGMRIGRGNRSTRRKPTPVPHRPLQIPHELTWDRTRAFVVGIRRLTARAMARQSADLMFEMGHQNQREQKQTIYSSRRKAPTFQLTSQPSRQRTTLHLQYCHVYQCVRMVFGLVIGFINHLHVVTTINYNTSKITVIITHK
jgi:hypothetical protein